MIIGDAAELIHEGRFGQIALGDSIDTVRDLLSDVPDLSSCFAWGIADEGKHEDGFYVLNSFQIHFKADENKVLRVGLIVVQPGEDGDGFLDDEKRFIYFKSRGMKRFQEVSDAVRILSELGIATYHDVVRGTYIKRYISKFSGLIFEYDEFEGQSADRATFVQFEIHRNEFFGEDN